MADAIIFEQNQRILKVALRHLRNTVLENDRGQCPPEGVWCFIASELNRSADIMTDLHRNQRFENTVSNESAGVRKRVYGGITRKKAATLDRRFGIRTRNRDASGKAGELTFRYNSLATVRDEKSVRIGLNSHLLPRKHPFSRKRTTMKGADAARNSNGLYAIEIGIGGVKDGIANTLTTVEHVFERASVKVYLRAVLRNKRLATGDKRARVKGQTRALMIRFEGGDLRPVDPDVDERDVRLMRDVHRGTKRVDASVVNEDVPYGESNFGDLETFLDIDESDLIDAD